MKKLASGPSLASGFPLALLLLGVSGGQALAHKSPSNCTTNRFVLAIEQNPAGNIVSGQTMNYTVSVFNPGPGIGIGCDVTSATVTFTCPGADGTSSGQTTVLGTALTFPADSSSDTIFAPVSCKIVVNSGVTSATARAQAGQVTGNRTQDLLNGAVHDSAIDDPFLQISELTVGVLTCAAKVDKQVSCDGGKTFHDVGLETADEDGHTDVCFGWNAFVVNGSAMPAEAIQVRYVVANAGTADLLTCTVTEGNSGFPSTVTVGALAGACVVDAECGNAQATCVNGACVFTSGPNNADCSPTLLAAEPDQATLTCDCTPTPGEAQTTAFDQAKFQCLTPGLAVTKECKTQAAGTNEVDITLMNTGMADLQNCVVTDKVFPNDPTCPPTTTASTDVTVAGVTSLPAGQSATVMGSVTGLTMNACNTVSVTCEIKDSVDPSNPSQPKKTPPATDQDVCPTPPTNCFARTPGFWGTHPYITQRVLGTGLPSCGLVVNTTAAATPVSSTEDICSVGTDSGANHTSPQQVQLIRQCMSAALNLAATAHAPQPGDCNSVFPGITQMFDTCCTGPTSVCDSGASPGAIDASGCIGTLDRFNNLETTFDFGVGEGPSKPADCQASKNNGFLNPGRNLGPAR